MSKALQSYRKALLAEKVAERFVELQAIVNQAGQLAADAGGQLQAPTFAPNAVGKMASAR